MSLSEIRYAAKKAIVNTHPDMVERFQALWAAEPDPAAALKDWERWNRDGCNLQPLIDWAKTQLQEQPCLSSS